jgi:hypothetical protein
LKICARPQNRNRYCPPACVKSNRPFSPLSCVESLPRRRRSLGICRIHKNVAAVDRLGSAPLRASRRISHASALPRRDAPELCKNRPPKTEGAGKAGCPLHPQPRAQSVESTRVSHHRFTGTPGFPRAMVLTASFALSPVTGLCCHRHRRSLLRQLDASVGASGPHDFTVRVSTVRLRTFVHRRCRVHRIPHPTFVTTAKRPSFGCGMAWVLKVFLPAGETNYFCEWDWTTQIRLNSLGKSRFTLARIPGLRAGADSPQMALHFRV